MFVSGDNESEFWKLDGSQQRCWIKDSRLYVRGGWIPVSVDRQREREREIDCNPGTVALSYEWWTFKPYGHKCLEIWRGNVFLWLGKWVQCGYFILKVKTRYFLLSEYIIYSYIRWFYESETSLPWVLKRTVICFVL
jgi:hypothetical protein